MAFLQNNFRCPPSGCSKILKDLKDLSTADVHALPQSEVVKCICSSILPTVVFHHTPLADLAAGWIADLHHPQWITGGILIGLDDAAVLAVVHGLVVSAPATMGVEVQAFVSMAGVGVKLVRLLLAGGGVVTIEPQAQLLPGDASPPPISSGVGGPSFEAGCAKTLTALLSGGAVADKPPELSPSFTRAGRTFSNQAVRAVCSSLIP